jgi:hypothetical protein
MANKRFTISPRGLSQTERTTTTTTAKKRYKQNLSAYSINGKSASANLEKAGVKHIDLAIL